MDFRNLLLVGETEEHRRRTTKQDELRSAGKGKQVVMEAAARRKLSFP